MKLKFISVFSMIALWSSLAMAGDPEDKGEAPAPSARLSVQEINNIVKEKGPRGAMTARGIGESRLCFVTLWGKSIEDFFIPECCSVKKGLIQIELHHIAGDMNHIARMIGTGKILRGGSYYHRIRSKQHYDEYGDSRRILTQENYEKEAAGMEADFKEMFVLFEHWREISETKKIGQMEDFLDNLLVVEEKFEKYRKERKLKLNGHPISTVLISVPDANDLI